MGAGLGLNGVNTINAANAWEEQQEPHTYTLENCDSSVTIEFDDGTTWERPTDCDDPPEPPDNPYTGGVERLIGGFIAMLIGGITTYGGTRIRSDS